jgi:hypothetical protein
MASRRSGVRGPAFVSGRFERAKQYTSDDELREPVEARLSGGSECRTEPDGERSVELTAADLGSVGVDRVGVRITLLAPDFADGTIHLLVNERSGHDGPITATELGQGNAMGEASFAALNPGAFDFAESTGRRASGTVTWACDTAPVPTSPPWEGPQALQGYFELGGLVDVPEVHATGMCSRAHDLGTDAIEAVVPWVDGVPVRLRLAPGRESATLTVLSNGAGSVTVTAAAVLVERRVETTGDVSSRRLDAEFMLPSGRLALTVEWDCGAVDQTDLKAP